MSINERVRTLAYCRKVEGEYKRYLAGLEAELQMSVLGQQIDRAKRLLNVAREDATDAEDRVRDVALEAYEHTQDKQPHPAVKVVMSTVLTYLNDHALVYCRTHLPQALRLDKRKFEKVAKVAELDFVDITTEPATRISRDLSQWLEEEDDED